MFAQELWQAALAAIRQRAYYTAYRNTFDVVRADTDDLRDKAFRLRYQVYCVENRIKDATGGDIERDLWDDAAIHHLLIHRATGETAGTVRVILPRKDEPLRSFPLQQVCDHPLLEMEDRIKGFCEISHLCMAKRFRRRDRDGRILPAYYEQDWSAIPLFEKIVTVRRLIPWAPVGLLGAAFETALEHRIMDGFLVVEPDDLRALAQVGLSWRVLGPRLYQHGTWQPLVFNIKNALDAMRTRNEKCWEVVSDRGRLHGIADALQVDDWQDSIFDTACRERIYGKLTE